MHTGSPRVHSSAGQWRRSGPWLASHVFTHNPFSKFCVVINKNPVGKHRMQVSCIRIASMVDLYLFTLHGLSKWAGTGNSHLGIPDGYWVGRALPAVINHLSNIPLKSRWLI